MKRKAVGLVALILMAAASAWAAGDTSALHPPPGHRMALVVWEDLECPACARAQPLLLQAQRNYHIPLVWHDFIIPVHRWSRQAAIMARYFDTKSPELGAEFRHFIFANQPSIYPATLREWADKFAAEHHVVLPAFYDPTGVLRAKVEADCRLGSITGQTGVLHTPTIYVVSDSPKMPFVEVTDQSKLFETIERVRAALPPEHSAGSRVRRRASR
jgi:protein-disulfide isomerase